MRRGVRISRRAAHREPGVRTAAGREISSAPVRCAPRRRPAREAVSVLNFLSSRRPGASSCAFSGRPTSGARPRRRRKATGPAGSVRIELRSSSGSLSGRKPSRRARASDRRLRRLRGRGPRRSAAARCGSRWVWTLSTSGIRLDCLLDPLGGLVRLAQRQVWGELQVQGEVHAAVALVTG